MSRSRGGKPGDDKPAQFKRQDASFDLLKGITLKKPYKFKESDYPYDYANVLAHVGSKADGDYTIVRMNDYLQFHIRHQPSTADSTTSTSDLRQRIMKFQTRKLDTDSVGWKLHISVNPEDIEAAWSIICKILVDHKVSGFKIIHPTLLLDAIRAENMEKMAGKQFTIYQFLNPKFNKEEWAGLIKEIENALQENNIRAGNIPIANQGIEGSQYFSYRNDANPAPDAKKPYLNDQEADLYAQASSDKTLKPYNLVKAADPFEDVRPFAEKKLNR